VTSEAIDEQPSGNQWKVWVAQSSIGGQIRGGRCQESVLRKHRKRWDEVGKK